MRADARLRWIDVVKGVCMVLVVLRHSALWLETEFSTSDQSAIWWEVSAFLSPIRMPLFFLVSGYLAARATRRPLSASKARTFGFWYIYAIWTGLFLLRLWLPMPGADDGSPNPLYFLLSLIFPTSFWYLWALAFFFLVAWTSQRLLGDGARWLTVVFFLLAFAAPLIDDALVPLIPAPFDALKVGSMAANLVWFFVGIHLKSTWDALMARSTTTLAIAAVALYTVSYAAALLLGVRDALLPALALIAMIACALLIARIPLEGRIAGMFERIGKATLPVYIFHIFAISALSAIVKLTGFSGWITANFQLAGALIPPLVTIVLVTASIIIGRLILASPVRWLLSPDWLKQSDPPKTEVKRA